MKQTYWIFESFRKSKFLLPSADGDGILLKRYIQKKIVHTYVICNRHIFPHRYGQENGDGGRIDISQDKDICLLQVEVSITFTFSKI